MHPTLYIEGWIVSIVSLLYLEGVYTLPVEVLLSVQVFADTQELVLYAPYNHVCFSLIDYL